MKRYKNLLMVLAVLVTGIIIVSCGSSGKEGKSADYLAIHDRVLTVDTHCDTAMDMIDGEWNIGERHDPGQRGSQKIDLPRMLEGGLNAEFFAVFVSQEELTPEARTRAKEQADLILDTLHNAWVNHPEMVELALTPDDAFRLKEEGRIAAFIGMENGYPVGTDLSLVEYFYNRGVRYITLCHGGDNDICDSSTDRDNTEDNGLSEFGKKVVAECNRIGMMIDISHASDMSFSDVLQYSKAPVFASHSCVRALCDHPRNLSDEMLKALADKGGVIQICFVSGFLKKEKPNPERDKAFEELRGKYGSYRKIKDEATRKEVREKYFEIYRKYPGEKATVQDVVDHIDHIAALVGVEHVGIGTDFDGGGGVDGCDDVTEMRNITKELVRRGYTEEEIGKIWGGNIMRVFQKVIDTAENL